MTAPELPDGWQWDEHGAANRSEASGVQLYEGEILTIGPVPVAIVEAVIARKRKTESEETT